MHVFCHFRPQPVERSRYKLSHLLWLVAVRETNDDVQRIGSSFYMDIGKESLSIGINGLINTNSLGIWKENLKNYYCHRANFDLDYAYFG